VYKGGINILLLIITFSYNGISTCMGEEVKRNYKNSITLLGGVGSRESINLLLKKAKLIPPHSYLIGIGYRRHGIFSSPVDLNIETMKHLGRQNSIELILYPSIESPVVYLGNIGLSWGIGNGISVMLGPYPKLEEYKSIKSRRLLNFLLLEQNIFLSSHPEVLLTFRLHHRCSLFRTMGSKGAGSNFLTLGFRYSF